MLLVQTQPLHVMSTALSAESSRQRLSAAVPVNSSPGHWAHGRVATAAMWHAAPERYHGKCETRSWQLLGIMNFGCHYWIKTHWVRGKLEKCCRGDRVHSESYMVVNTMSKEQLGSCDSGA